MIKLALHSCTLLTVRSTQGADSILRKSNNNRQSNSLAPPPPFCNPTKHSGETTWEWCIFSFFFSVNSPLLQILHGFSTRCPIRHFIYSSSSQSPAINSLVPCPAISFINNNGRPPRGRSHRQQDRGLQGRREEDSPGVPGARYVLTLPSQCHLIDTLFVCKPLY